MANKVILVLQGGGALGAYECGVYKALVLHLAEHGQTLCAVAGTSIGAINASLIALGYGRDRDQGARALEEFWTTELATRSVPFLPLAEFQPLNAVWTSLLFGNPRLYSPHFFGWDLLPRFFLGAATRFYDTVPMRNTLISHFAPSGKYQGTSPQLIVTAVDITAGTPEVFDSRLDAGVTPADVMACCALPPWLPEQLLKGRHYWDGGLWSNTPLRDALNALQDRSDFDGAGQEYDVYIVDLFPREADLPQTNWAIWSRINQITFADKTDFERKVTTRMNDYIEFVRGAYDDAKDLPATSPLKMRIEREHRELIDNKRVVLNVFQIQRKALPGETISREIDFSPERIANLIEQGYRDAPAQIEAAAAAKRAAN